MGNIKIIGSAVSKRQHPIGWDCKSKRVYYSKEMAEINWIDTFILADTESIARQRAQEYIDKNSID